MNTILEKCLVLIQNTYPLTKYKLLRILVYARKNLMKDDQDKVSDAYKKKIKQ
jgi:hypothetical protein